MFVCLDLETTGLSAQDDHIIEVAIVRFDHEKIVDEWSSLVKPSVSIPAFTMHLTGINNEMVKDAPSLAELKAIILEKLGDYPIMGHFIPFDIGFLNAKGFGLTNAPLDTCQLAQAFLAKEPSYSLEVLCQKLNICQVSAHRALDDVKANIDLFWRISSHVRALSQNEKETVRPLLEKSDWPWAVHLLPLLDETGGEKIPPTEDADRAVHSEVHANLSELSQDLTPPFLLEERSHTYQDLLAYALAQDKKSLLVVAAPEKVPPHADAGILKHPSYYLDEERFHSFLKKERLNGVETMIGVKMSLWLLETETGEKSELRFIKEEKEIWFDLACQEGGTPQSFFARAQNKGLEKKVMVVSHQYLLKDRSRKDPLLELPEHLIVGEVEQLVQALEEAWHIRLSETRFIQDLHRLKKDNPTAEELIDALATKVSILFGFLGMMLQNQGTPNDPRHALVLEAHHFNTTEWNKVKGSAQSIENAAAALGESCKETPNLEEFTRYLLYLTKILQMDSPLLWLSFSKEGQPIVHAFPKNTHEIFVERVWKAVPNLHLFANHGNLKDDFAFLKQELGLPPETLFKSAEEIFPLPLYYPETPIKNPNDAQNIEEAVNELKKWLTEQEGNAIIIANSMTTAEQFFYKLAKPCKELGRKLLVQNLSGGMGKITKLSGKTDGKNVFVGNESFLDFLLEEGINLSFLALHRIPFSSPEDPIQKARTARLKDAYKEFTLPQAGLRYATLLRHFLGNEWKGKKILVLDPRIHDYEGHFS
ncbi:MAG: exonuclease domain-containing protein [Candidatus Gracilibacteria bacterium]|jgi:DNA polymerase III epsilon subunit-like protein